jgi:hypothetical protein
MADTSGAGLDRTKSGGSSAGHVGNHSLAHAVGHLKAEHPIAYDNLGPHHSGGGMTKHMPLGGMKPCGPI